MFLLYDFNVVLFIYLCRFLIGGFRGFNFGITWGHMRISSIGSNYIMQHFLYCYKTSWVIVYVANNYCMEGVWIGYLFYFLLVECMDRFFYKCVVEINVLFKCDVLIM